MRRSAAYTGVVVVASSWGLPEPLARKAREMMDLERSEPALVQRLLEKALQRARERRDIYQRLREAGVEALREALSRGLIREAPEPEPSARSYGADGSRQLVGGGMGSYYALLSAVVVGLPEGIASRSPVILYPGAEVVEILDPTGAAAEAAAEAAQMVLETLALSRLECMEPGVVFIDGPVADPPSRLDPAASARAVAGLLGVDPSEALRLVEGYHCARAAVVAALLERGHLAAGVVKRIGRVRLLASRLRSAAGLPGMGDEELAAALAAAARSRLGRPFYTEPLEASSIPRDVYRCYRRRGLRIYASYTVSPYTLRPYRLEAPVPEGGDPHAVMERLAAAAHGLTLPGQSHPLPVVLAHEKARLRRGLAELVYREIIARATLPEGDPEADTLKALLAGLDMAHE
ncbi:hypothetical protein CF15_07000 [Pyrodictium occultum]|uniref:NurA domain-containing protein n=1 Tax=Pyrodictium occultum TaxID=2309 RepID=A0A0V8RWM4_PYROC|nr:DNA double-strand break repair nuclease NurA [Pyrodictium occultum]KSW12462.1 hypothetical protein CF15_07000 [Pyrodictium occultum]